LDSRVLLLQTDHPGIFAINFFYKASEAEISTTWIQNVGELRVEISDVGSLYFLRYGLKKLEFLQAPKFNLKQVT